VAAASAALIAWWPALERHHLAMGLALLTLVTVLVVAGARGRLALAAMTSAFVLCAAVVVGGSLDSGLETATSVAGRDGSDGGSLLLVLLAMSGAMALATGIEAPSSAIAELDVGSRRRRRIGRLTLVATVVVVTLLTITLTVLASGVEPRETDTLLAAVVRGAVGDGAGFAVFQVTSALLLLAAAGSSLQAGPGIVRALSGSVDGRGSSILPAWTGRSTGEGVPWLAVLAFALVAAVVMALAGADEQALVVFYAASVFLGFAFGIAAMARINLRRRAWGALAVNAIGLVVTGATLVASVSRGWPIVPLATSVAIATALWLAWRRSGRPPLRIARTD